MKLGILGDIHFKNCKTEIEKTYRSKVLDFVANTLQEKNVETIIQLGDFFNDRKHLDMQVLEDVIKDYQYYFSDFQHFYCLAGNHDVYYKTKNCVNSIKHLSSFFDNFEHIQSCVEIPKIGLVVPWLNENNNEAFLKACEEKTYKYCFGHFEINGFAKIKGFDENNGLSSSLFHSFQKTFSGHFHLTQDKNNICYVGSLFQNDKNDINDIKRIMILDTDTDEIEEVRIPFELFKRITINEESELNVDSLKSLEGHIVDFVFNIERSLKREKFIDYIMSNENFIYQIIDNSQLCKEKVELRVDNEEVVSIFKDYLGISESYDDKRKSALKDLFVEVYDGVTKV